MKNAKKFFALLVTMAMVMSLFSGVVLAAAPAAAVSAIGFEGTAAKNEDAVIKFTVAATDTDIKNVSIDFANTGFVPDVVGNQTLNSTWTPAVASNKVTFSNATGITDGNTLTFKVKVKNPNLTTNIISGLVFAASALEAPTVAGDYLPITVANYSLNVGAITVSPTNVVAGQVTNVSVTANYVAVGSTLTYKVYNGKTPTADLVAQGSANGSSFTIPVYFAINTTGALSETYKVEVFDGGVKLGEASVVAKYNLQLDAIGDVNRGEIKTITGKLLDAAGAGVKNQEISLRASASSYARSSIVASSTTAIDGSFVFSYQFNVADTYKIFVGESDYADVAVKAQDGLALTFGTSGSPAPLTALDDTNDLVVTVKRNGTTVTVPGVLSITGPSGWTRPTGWDSLSFTGVGTFAHGAAGFAGWDAGEYTITAKVGGTGTNYDYVTTAKFTIAPAAKLNYSVKIDGATSSLYAKKGAEVQVTLNDINGKGFRDTDSSNYITKVVYTVTGPVAASVTYDTSKLSTADYNALVAAKSKAFNTTVDIEQAGNLTVSGTVTYLDGSTQTFEKVIAISGYIVTIEKTLGSVGDEVTLTATVTTTDGTPVNNARVTWNADNTARFQVKNTDGTYANATNSVSVAAFDYAGTTGTNINNGVYSKTVKLAAAGDVTVGVYTNAPATRALFAGKVLGTPVYNVTLSKTNLVATLTQTFDVTVTNTDGSSVMALSGLKVESKDAQIGTVTGTLSTPVNLDGIAGNESYRISVTPAAAGTITVTAETEGGNKVGIATITVVAPTVNVTPDMNVTDAVKEEITVTYGDEVALGAQLRVTPLGMGTKGTAGAAGTGTTIIYDGSTTWTHGAQNQLLDAYTFAKATSHTFKVLAKDVTETTAVAPELKLEVSYNGSDWVEAGRLVVKPISIEVDKEEVNIGVNTAVTVTVKDAHGKAMANKTVNATSAAAATGTTDDNGVTTLTINPASTGNIVLTVTSNSKDFTKTVKAVADAEKPVITIDTLAAKVKTNVVTVTGTVKDNVKVATVYVNNTPVLVIPGQESTFEAQVNLKLGNNVIRVFAFDAAGNAEKAETTVEYVAPVVVKLGIKSNDALVNNQPITIDSAPYLKGVGTTMVELRSIANAIGAQLGWDAATQTVTLTRGDLSVSLQVGVKTAVVNGNVVEMPEAPELSAQSRTMIPLRFVTEQLGFYVEWNTSGGITLVEL